jgi:hypothetical protein
MRYRLYNATNTVIHLGKLILQAGSNSEWQEGEIPNIPLGFDIRVEKEGVAEEATEEATEEVEEESSDEKEDSKDTSVDNTNLLQEQANIELGDNVKANPENAKSPKPVLNERGTKK